MVLATTDGETEGKCFPERRRTACIDDVRQWTGDDMNVARTKLQWKEDTTAGSRMSTGRSAYGIRTTTFSYFLTAFTDSHTFLEYYALFAVNIVTYQAPAAKAGLYATVMSICLFVCLSVCDLSVAWNAYCCWRAYGPTAPGVFLMLLSRNKTSPAPLNLC